MHPELSKERPDLCPPQCQLYVLHGDAQSSGEQKLLCVTACNSQVHLVLTWGSVFWRWAAVAVERLWRCHENNKHQSIAMTGNLKETISGCSDANEFCIDKSNKVTSVTFDMCRPVLFVWFFCLLWEICSWTACVSLITSREGQKRGNQRISIWQKSPCSSKLPYMQPRSVLLSLATNCRGMERGLEGNMLLSNIVPGALCYAYTLSFGTVRKNERTLMVTV